MTDSRFPNRADHSTKQQQDMFTLSVSLLHHNLDLHDPLLRQVPFVIVTVSWLQFLSQIHQAKEMSKFLMILMCAALPVVVACPLSSSMQKWQRWRHFCGRRCAKQCPCVTNPQVEFHLTRVGVVLQWWGIHAGSRQWFSQTKNGVEQDTERRPMRSPTADVSHWCTCFVATRKIFGFYISVVHSF